MCENRQSEARQAVASSAAEILLVEDNPGDARLAREAFREAGIGARLHLATDGAEALAFLRACGSNGAPRLPDLVLLDINLPRQNGHEVLEEIRADPALRALPVVVLTTSPAEEDMLRARRLQVSAYIAKPVELAQFIEAVRRLDIFWGARAPAP